VQRALAHEGARALRVGAARYHVRLAAELRDRGALACRITFKESRDDGPYTLPGLTPSIQYPGPAGGFDWAGYDVRMDTHTACACTAANVWIARFGLIS
jgi:glucose dehydrogenase